MLNNGERVGGTTLTAKSLPDAVGVLGVSPRGTRFNPGPAVYMKKLIVLGDVAEHIDFDAPSPTPSPGSPRPPTEPCAISPWRCSTGPGTSSCG